MIQSVRDHVRYFLAHGGRGGAHNLSLCFNRLCQEIDGDREKVAKEAAIEKMKDGYTHEAFHLYQRAFREWRRIFETDPDAVSFEMMTISPMVVGKSDQNVHGYGMTLQHPWGTPMIPGAAIKGVLSAWAHHHGDDAWRKSGWGGPAGMYAAAMFGGADNGGGLRAGGLDFMNAWWVPKSPRPFVEDIINVHYRGYYQGGAGNWPDGMESPVPNKFIVVKAGERFLFVIRGQAAWRDLARDMLIRAGGEQGFGSKTRVGYGRLAYVKSTAELSSEIPLLDDEALSELFAKEKNNPDMQGVFREEARRRDVSLILLDLFKKFRPAAALLAEIRNKKPASMKDAKIIRDGYGRMLPAAEIDSRDPDIQAIFDFCLTLAPGGKPAGTWLAAFQYGAEHLLEGKTFDQIEAMIDTYSRPWPLLEAFRSAVGSLQSLNDEEKEYLLELLEEQRK